MRPIHDTVFAWPPFLPNSWYPHHPCALWVGSGAVLDDDYLLLLPMLMLMPILKRHTLSLNITKFACLLSPAGADEGWLHLNLPQVLIEYVEPQNGIFLVILDFLRCWHSEIHTCDASIWCLMPFHLEIQPRRRICSGHQSQFSWVRQGFQKWQDLESKPLPFPKSWQSLTHVDTYWHIVRTRHSIVYSI